MSEDLCVLFLTGEISWQIAAVIETQLWHHATPLAAENVKESERRSESVTETEITIETGTGSETAIEPRKKLLAALSDGEDAPRLHHPYPMRGAAGARMKGRNALVVMICKAYCVNADSAFRLLFSYFFYSVLFNNLIYFYILCAF